MQPNGLGRPQRVVTSQWEVTVLDAISGNPDKGKRKGSHVWGSFNLLMMSTYCSKHVQAYNKLVVKQDFVRWIKRDQLDVTCWINWTNLMSLYESFVLLNMFRMLLHSSSGADECMWVYCSVSVCTGVLVRFGWSRVVSECRLEHYTVHLHTVAGSWGWM